MPKRKYYDPDPGRRHRSRGHRKGVEPAGLKRWRLAHLHRTHDPGRPRRHFRRHARRLDPAPRFRRARTYFASHPRYRRTGSKLEHGINKYGGIVGALLGLGAGIAKGYSDYSTAYGPNAGNNYLHTIVGGDMKDKAGTKIGTRTPEISHLWGMNDTFWGAPRGPIDYLKYKFLGLETNNTYKGSAWSIPFIASLIGTLAAPIARLFTHKGQRFLKPISKISTGVLAVSTIGALFLPGCGKADAERSNQLRPPPPQNGGPVPPNQFNNPIKGAF